MNSKIQYDAFISYNHNARDIKIAKELQTRLENYRILKEFQTNYGYKKIERVFLDVGELGVSADLNETIKDALDNSRYLIVISSPESKQSPWVHKEIEYFLSSHSVDNILTVITDGEPKEVLPEVIMKKEITDEDGNTKIIDREPLSGDYRIDLKKAHKVELPRIVSTIIGCKYDDLVQRQKQYRMKQITALFAGISVFMMAALAYVIWSNQTIKKNYNNTLEEQSRILAIQSEEALNNGDRISAIELAIKALPNNNERPLIHEAVYALSEATDIYKDSEYERWVGAKRYSRYETYISKFELTSYKNKTVLAELFSSGRLALYDAETGKEICEEYTKNLHDNDCRIEDITYYDESKLLLICHEAVIMYDIEEEKELYREKTDFFLKRPDDERPAIAGDELWLVAQDYNSDESRFDNFFVKIDLNSGKVSERISTDLERACDLVVSDDGRYLSYFDDTEDESVESLYVYDTAENRVVTTISRQDITDIDFDNANNLIACSIDSKLSEDEEFVKSSRVTIDDTVFTIAEDMAIDITYISPKDGRILWQNKVEKLINGTPRANVSFGGLKDKNSIYKDKILCKDNSLLMIFNPDGKLEREIDFRSTIIKLHYNPEHTDRINAILENGYRASYDMAQNDLRTLHNVFNGPVEAAETHEGFVYTMRNGPAFSDHYITKYILGGCDPEFKEYSITENERRDYETRIDAYDEYFIEKRGSDSSQEFSFKTRHCKSGEVYLEKRISLNDEEFRYYYAGVDESSGKAVFVGDDYSGNYKCVTFDVLDGKKTESLFPYNNSKDDEDNSVDYSRIIGSKLKDGSVYTPTVKRVSNYKKDEEFYSVTLIRLDIDTGKREEYEITGITDAQAKKLQFEGNMIIDTQNELLIAFDEDKLICCKFNGTKEWEIEKPIDQINSLGCIDKRLLISGESDLKSVIYVYDITNGKKLGSVVFENGETIYGNLNPIQLSEDEICTSAGGFDAYILDNDSYGLRSIVPHCCAYNPKEKEFAVGGTGSSTYGHVPYRSLEELIDLGNSIVGK